MKILICNPPWENTEGYGCRSNTRWPHIRKDKYLIFPLYLGYAAAVLEKHGLGVAVVDAVAADYDSDKFISRLREEAGSMCFLETSTPTIAQDTANAVRIRKELGIPVFLLGPHATVYHKELLEENPLIDGVIRGEFEYTIRDVSLGLPLEKVLGLTWRSGPEVRVNEPRPYIENLDELPFPAWHLFDWKAYESHLYASPSMWMITTRGCPFQCTFCLWPDTMCGRRQRYRSAMNVVDEIETLVNKYHVKEVRFDDDTFALKKSHVLGIADELMKRGLHKKVQWACFGHASQDDREIYEKIKAAGCFRIDFGIESGSQRILDSVGKMLDIEKAKRTARICREIGLRFYCTFIVGFPGETAEDIEKSIALAIELDPDLIQVSNIVPYPGTRMYADGIKNNFLVYPGQWDKYNSCQPMVNSGMPPEEVQRYYLRFWRRFYLRPTIILRHLKRMFSSFADFKRVLMGFISFFNRFIK